MAWIEVIDEAEVEARGGHLARLYRAAVDEHTGRVDNVLQIHSLRPRTLDGHLRLYHAVMREPAGLSTREREAIAVVVSAANGCRY